MNTATTTTPTPIDLNAYLLREVDGQFYLLRAAVAGALVADASADALALVCLESFEDEGLARDELAQINLRHGCAAAKRMTRAALLELGGAAPSSDAAASRFCSEVAAEAVDYVFSNIECVDPDTIKTGADAADVLADAACDWLGGLLVGGLSDAKQARREQHALDLEAEEAGPFCELCGAYNVELDHDDLDDTLACLPCLKHRAEKIAEGTN